MAKFDSLEKTLDNWFELPLYELPSPIKRRVITAYQMWSWNELSPNQRRSIAQQQDYQNNPATQDHREFWFNFYTNLHKLQRKIGQWEKVAAPTAMDLKQKESKLGKLQKRQAHLLRLKDLFLERGFPQLASSEGEPANPDAIFYLAFPAVLHKLQKQHKATAEEIAAWIFIGPEKGGIRAYIKPRNGKDIARFLFQPYVEEDYKSLLFNCWFLESEISDFEPVERYLSGRALIARWEVQLTEDAVSFTKAKISGGELIDLHPVKGATEATVSESDNFPLLETGLFSMSEIEKIELEEGIELTDDSYFLPKQEGESPSERRERTLQWIAMETRLRGERGAIKRVAEKEGVSRQRISQIIKSKPQ